MTSSRTSSIMAENCFKMADLLRLFAFYVNNLTCWRDKSFSYIPFTFVMHDTNKQLLDKLNNG